jgi:hypothetical protein
MIKPERMAAKDRRRAAIHEAGHVTIGRYIGLKAVSALLVKVEGGGLCEKHWIGHTRYLSPQILNQKTPRKKLAMFSVAGAVAEFCWQHDTFEETLDYDAWSDENVMSSTDWAGCDCSPGRPTRQLFRTIEATFALLDRKGELWAELLKEARLLIVMSR